MFDRVTRGAVLEVMDDVHSMTMGLWHLSMARGQGGLSHQVLSRGFILIEVLRGSPPAGTCISLQDTADFEGVVDSYESVVQAVFRHLNDCGEQAKYKGRADRVLLRCRSLFPLMKPLNGPIFKLESDRPQVQGELYAKQPKVDNSGSINSIPESNR